MKVRNYEKKLMVYIFVVILILIEIIVVLLLYKNKIYKYELVSGVVIKENLVVLIINNKTKNNINKNNYLYLNNKKIKYQIVEDRGYVLKRNKQKYSEILLQFKFDKNYKVNDSLQLMLKDEKIKIVEIFKVVWDGD